MKTLKIATLFFVTMLFSCGSDSPTSVAGTSSTTSTTSSASSSGVKYGADVVVGSETYKTVVIGSQTWFARNLNSPTASGSSCYLGLDSNCQIYGRLYTITAAKTLCPAPWHLPSKADCSTVEKNIPVIRDGALKANSNLWQPNTGTDQYGFNALPAGQAEMTNADTLSYGALSTNATYWTSTADTMFTERYWTIALVASMSGVGGFADDSTSQHSVRCMK